jgi:hypothetical protein
MRQAFRASLLRNAWHFSPKLLMLLMGGLSWQFNGNRLQGSNEGKRQHAFLKTTLKCKLRDQKSVHAPHAQKAGDGQMRGKTDASI